MKEIKLDELKVIQMNVLGVIDKFCTANSLNYSIACGTMLGAIRHKGYIPWDDDIDIYMLREDYNKLISLFPAVYEDIKLTTLERDKTWNRSYGQAYNCKTIMEEPGCTTEKGVAIDIFPIDDVPDNQDEWLNYNRKRSFYQKVYELKVMPFMLRRSFAKNVFLAFSKVILLPFSSRKIATFIDRNSQRFNGKGFKRAYECCQGDFQNNPFPKSLMQEFIYVPFENVEFKCMKGHHDYLTNAYGNYMQLPPKEKQVSHHVFKAWWK